MVSNECVILMNVAVRIVANGRSKGQSSPEVQKSRSREKARMG